MSVQLESVFNHLFPGKILEIKNAYGLLCRKINSSMAEQIIFCDSPAEEFAIYFLCVEKKLVMLKMDTHFRILHPENSRTKKIFARYFPRDVTKLIQGYLMIDIIFLQQLKWPVESIDMLLGGEELFLTQTPIISFFQTCFAPPAPVRPLTFYSQRSNYQRSNSHSISGNGRLSRRRTKNWR